MRLEAWRYASMKFVLNETLYMLQNFCRYTKPLHMDTGDFLVEIAAGEGDQYLRHGYGHPSLDALVTMYQLSDMHKDVLRLVRSESVVHARWVESEPNLGLSVRRKKPKKGKTTTALDIHSGPYQGRQMSSFDRENTGTPLRQSIKTDT
jgi:hypothetical protein